MIYHPSVDLESMRHLASLNTWKVRCGPSLPVPFVGASCKEGDDMYYMTLQAMICTT